MCALLHARNIADFLCGILNCAADLSKMDQLPTDQQEALRKTNTERLRLMAANTYDVGDDELETMDRTALLDVIATDIVARGVLPVGGGRKNQIRYGRWSYS